jgi:hypothetical protein
LDHSTPGRSSFHELPLAPAIPEWGGRWDSNPRRLESQSRTLPTELRPPYIVFTGAPGRNRTCNRRLRRPVLYPVELRAQVLLKPVTGPAPCRDLVGVERFELPTSCSQSRRATRLRYTPNAERNQTTLLSLIMIRAPPLPVNKLARYTVAAPAPSQGPGTVTIAAGLLVRACRHMREFPASPRITRPTP